MKERIKALWLAEAIRLTEQHSGRFADQQANRIAKSAGDSVTDKLLARAQILGQQHGLEQIQQRYIHASKLAFMLLLVLALFLGGALSAGALSQQPINLFWALVSILGLHLLSLIIWLFSFIFFPQESGSLLIQFWLWLSRRFTHKQVVKQLLPAFGSLFGARIRWFFGLLLNLFWSVLLSAALIGLLFLFSTKHYGFIWQTTLLSSETLISWVNGLGALPHWLGFAIPSREIIQQSGDTVLNAAEIRASWASWFIGVVLVYGVLLRWLLSLLCYLNWRCAQRNAKLDLNQPELQIIIQKLTTPAATIIDQAQATNATHYPAIKLSHAVNIGIVAIDMSADWQPPTEHFYYGLINNRQQRQQILDELQHSPAKRLLIAVDSDRVPDRGMLNLIQELQSKAQQSAVWLINDGKQFANWQQALTQLSIAQQTPAWLNKEL